jgi:tetratricopeptide (TPR) repeat protein
VRLDEVVLRALETNPETRYQRASVLKTQVELITATPTNPVAAQTHLQPSITNMNRNANKSIWPWAVSAIVAVCLLALGFALFHKSVKPVHGKAVDYHQLGDARQDKGDWNGAIAAYTKAIELAPDDEVAYRNRGDARQGKADWEAAIADYTKAIELAPDDAGAYLNRSLAKKANGDLEGAAADHSKALKLKPDLESSATNPPVGITGTPAHSGQDQIAEGKGWNGFKVGATRAELIQALGQPDSDSDNRWMKWKQAHVHCLINDGGAFELRFDEGFPGITTAGIGIGSPLKSALAAYGEPSSQENVGSAKKLIWTSKGILIWFHEDKAAQIVVFQKTEQN